MKTITTKHWKVDGPAHLGRVVTDDDDRIIVAENLSIHDAPLIASAPELLAALEMVRLADVHKNAREAIVAAIAKAKGEA